MENLQKETVEVLRDEVEKVFRSHGLTDEETASVWNGIEAWCLYQLLVKKGPFYEMLKASDTEAIDSD